MGASILPISIYENKIYFLFGKERDTDENPGWSDFGGGTDNNETFLQTAIREGSEELTGFLGSPEDIKRMLSKYGTYNIDYKSNGHSTYRAHIFPIPYDDKLVFYYNNNQRFLQDKLDPKIINDTKIFEKTQIKWFTFDEIKQNKSKFRSFYQNIVALILQNKNGIQKFVRTKLSKTQKKKTNNNKTRKTQVKP